MTFNGYSYYCISNLTLDVSVNLQHDRQVLKYSIQKSLHCQLFVTSFKLPHTTSHLFNETEQDLSYNI
jgi:hypothetical protein